MTPRAKLPVRVRSGTPTDLDNDAVQGPGGIYRESFETAFEEVAAGRAAVLVAEDPAAELADRADQANRGLIEGAHRGLMGRVLLRWPDGPLVAELSGLVVVVEYRGRGVGSALMAAAHRAVDARGGEQVRLTVSRANVDVVRWYERLGYVQVGTSISSGLTSSAGVVVHAPEPVCELVIAVPGAATSARGSQ